MGIKRSAKFTKLLRPLSSTKITNTKTLTKKTYISWAPHKTLSQQSYDDPTPIRRVLRKLWRCATRVRQELEQKDQSCLDRDQDALSVKGVIYAVYCFQTRKLYVGQTKNTAFFRFQEHVRRSLREEGESLHRAMRRYGWNKFRIFPLEKIPDCLYMGKSSHKDETKAFRAAATPRERFWIDYLHSFAPLGWNCEFKHRTRRRQRRRRNPMKWRRQQQLPSDIHKNRKQPVDTNPVSTRWYGSRDWHRRCAYLANCYHSGHFDKICWERYKLKTLARMLSYLESISESIADEQPAIDTVAGQVIIEKLRSLLLKRYRPPKKPKDPKLWIRVEWTTHQLRRIGLKSILLQPEVKALLPYSVSQLWDDENLVIAKKLTRSIRGLILNAPKVLKKFDKIQLPTTSCPCRRHYAKEYRPQGGCVLSGNLNLVKSEKLRTVLAFGPNFRDKSTDMPVEAVETALDDFAIRFSDDYTPTSAFDDWKQHILQICSQRVESVDHRSRRHTPYLTKQTRKELRRLHRHLIVVPLDKAANNVGFICKALYCQRLRKELTQENGAYEITEEQKQALLDNHKTYLKQLKMLGKAKLPSMYWLPKFHKDPVGARFIAASVDCTTSKLSKILSDVLGLVLETLREKDDETLSKTGIRRFFIVQTFEEVSGFLGKWVRKNHANSDGLYTGDFATMYTTIPHSDLFNAMEQVTKEAFTWASKQFQGRQPCIRWTGGSSCKWVRGNTNHSKTTHTLSLESLNELIAYLVSNTYLEVGDAIYRQTIGIPMGTNCAPALANLYLYYYESQYVSKIEEEQGINAARTFHTTFRLIDDVLALDNPNLLPALSASYEEGGMYPEALTLEQTSSSNNAVNFLGMHIKTADKRLNLSVYDKRMDFPFKVKRYPVMKSLIPSYIPYGVFLGQLHRGYRICTQATNFLSYALHVATTLRENGCSINKLKRGFTSFVTNFVKKYPSIRRICKQFCNGLGSK